MTSKEAIDIFEGVGELEGISMFYQPGGKAGKLTIRGIKEASQLAITALRAQQTPAKLDRSRWWGCETCKGGRYRRGEYCPGCGRPLTEEAWAELERRINDGTIDL